MKKLSLCCVLVGLTLFSFSSVAQATGLEIEPYGGFGFIGTNSASGWSDTYSGFGFGGRIDYTFMDLIFVGVDGSILPLTSYSSNNAAMGITGTANSVKIGAVAGLRFAFPLRVWFGYNFIDNLNLTGSVISVPLGIQFPGSSFKIGAGYSVIPLLSFNLEYFFVSYSSMTQTAMGASVTQALSGASAFSGGFLFLSASVPISF